MSEIEWEDGYWFEALDRIATLQSMLDVLMIEMDDDENEVWHPAICRAELDTEINTIRMNLASLYQKMGEAMGIHDGEVH